MSPLIFDIDFNHPTILQQNRVAPSNSFEDVYKTANTNRFGKVEFLRAQKPTQPCATVKLVWLCLSPTHTHPRPWGLERGTPSSRHLFSAPPRLCVRIHSKSTEASP